MKKTRILVVVANDATKNKEEKRYTAIGPNSRQRLTEAVAWTEEHLPTSLQFWVFGAGTHLEYRRGPTLGLLAEAYLRILAPSAKAVANTGEKHYYGTLEEIIWGVRAVGQRYKYDAAEFVFFGPWWHLWRVRLIWALFFRAKWGRARFVATKDGARFNLRHELQAWVKIVLCWTGLLKSRDQTPYPSV